MFWRLLFGATVVLFLVMWVVRAVLEVFFRRPDLSGVGKVAWASACLRLTRCASVLTLEDPTHECSSLVRVSG